jgi:hypothetical protein
MVADYLTPVHRNPDGMPKGLAYEMDESLIYFRFYSTSTTLTVPSLSEKIRNALKEKGYTGPHDIFQRKEQKTSDRQTLKGHWRNESQAGFQQFSVEISIPEDKLGASKKLAEIMWLMLNPRTFFRNIYFAHIDQSHFYGKVCEELLRDATGSTGSVISPMCKNCLMFHGEEKCQYFLC